MTQPVITGVVMLGGNTVRVTFDQAMDPDRLGLGGFDPAVIAANWVLSVVTPGAKPAVFAGASTPTPTTMHLFLYEDDSAEEPRFLTNGATYELAHYAPATNPAGETLVPGATQFVGVGTAPSSFLVASDANKFVVAVHQIPLVGFGPIDEDTVALVLNGVQAIQDGVAQAGYTVTYTTVEREHMLFGNSPTDTFFLEWLFVEVVPAAAWPDEQRCREWQL